VKQRSPKRDDVVDKVRTTFWFQYLGTSLGTFHPRVVQRTISPTPSTDARGGAIKNNKFLGYSKGEHVPNAALVRRAAEIYPGSAHILNHVVWQVLRSGNQIEVRARTWIAQLDPEVQKVLIKPRNEFKEGRLAIDMLERRFSLDSLAALTILFRLSHDGVSSKDDAKAPGSFRSWMYACAIFQVLMMMGSQFISDELKNDIFQLFVQRVFSLVTSFWGMRMDLGTYDYPQMSSILREEAANCGIYIRSPLRRNEHNRIAALIKIPLIPANFA
jgi:hypothetical protein